MKTKNIKGSEYYQAPEIRSGTEYSVEKADIFSLGVIFFSIMFLNFPSVEGMDVGIDSFFNDAYKNFLPTDSRHPDDALRMIFACLSKNPHERPTIEDIYNVPWIRDAPTMLDDELRQEIQTIFALHKNPKSKE